MEYQDIQVKELSQRTGISKNTLDKYLSGSQSLPSVEKAAKIAKALNVSVEYLLSAEENITKRDPEISQEDLNILTSYRKLSREKKELIYNRFIENAETVDYFRYKDYKVAVIFIVETNENVLSYKIAGLDSGLEAV